MSQIQQGVRTKWNAIGDWTSRLAPTPRMPVVFLGHGSPMNALEENEFVAGFRNLAADLPEPSAMVCVSAHWETIGTYVTAMEAPRTIHDFGGFPPELYDISYPAPGNPALAQSIQDMPRSTSVHLDQKWGLDHGAWTVLRHMYPEANIPVIQLSLDIRKSPAEHYRFASELASLRDKGVLIVGSGNMVHNLSRVDWSRLDVDYAYDWAKDASEQMKHCIIDGDHAPLLGYQKMGSAMQMAVPTPEHFLPLLYTLSLQEDGEEVQLFNDKAVGGSLTMTSVRVG